MSEAPSRIARYELERKLGEGGMGEVYLARDPTLDRNIALKILPPELALHPERLSRFTQEAMLASALSHPNVAHIYEMGHADGVWFITMEYVEGEPLSARIAQQGSLPARDVVRIGMDVADVLDAAHEKGIIHRDIKPANLMLDARGRVKVLDFGLAKREAQVTAPEDTQIVTSAGVVLGTVRYMSPEQALGQDVDYRTDIFSLGVVLYESVTGQVPFAGRTPQETIARLLNSHPGGALRVGAEVPAGLERIVRKCLEKDRENRYQSARDLHTDLAALDRELAGSAQETRTETGGTQTALGVIIVDDEELARLLLREYLDAMPDMKVLAECGNGFEAVKAIAEHKPDLVFLDVQMPKLDGFEVLELIGREIPVIFVTAYDQYAMRAFDAHAVDYLLKPVSADRFRKAVERARQRLGQTTPPAPELAAAARPPQQFAQRIVVKDGTKVHIIPVDRLDYAEAQDDYVSLHSQGKSYLKQQTISSLESTLDPSQFIRIHRSYLINFERVARIEPYSKDSRIVVLTGGQQLPVSRAGYERLKALLDERK